MCLLVVKLNGEHFHLMHVCCHYQNLHHVACVYACLCLYVHISSKLWAEVYYCKCYAGSLRRMHI